MPALDSILNFAIPFLIIGGMIFLIYKVAKEPIDQFYGWIKGMIQSNEKETTMRIQQFSEIIYE